MTKKSGKSKTTAAVLARQQRGKTSKKQAKEQKQLTLLGNALRTLGGLGGSAIGSYLGNPAVGAATGASFGAAISKWLGSGDYTVKSNSILTPDQSIPAMHNSGQSVIVRHKEFVGTVIGSSAFTVQSVLNLNPGLPTTFPWLSRLASCYQQYRIRGLVFHYIPTSGDAISSTNPALGSVMLQTTYRATEDAPSSKSELLNEYWSTETVPSQPIAHPIECDPAENPFQIHYVRATGLSPTDEPLLFDMGKTFVCTAGMQVDGKAVGDLWATYEIELYKPIVKSSVSALGFSSADGIGAIGLNLYANAIFTYNACNISLSYNTMTFPKLAARYMVAYIFQTPITSMSLQPTISVVGCTSTAVTATTVAAGSSVYKCSMIYLIDCTDVLQAPSWSMTSFPGTLTPSTFDYTVMVARIF